MTPLQVTVSVALVVVAPDATGLQVLLRTGDRHPGLTDAPLDPIESVQDTHDQVQAEHAHLVDRIGLVTLLDTVGPRQHLDGRAVVTIVLLALARAPENPDRTGPVVWTPVRAVPTNASIRPLVDAAVWLREVFEAFWACPSNRATSTARSPTRRGSWSIQEHGLILPWLCGVGLLDDHSSQ